MKKEQVSFTAEDFRSIYCTNYERFCAVMFKGKNDYYTLEKWQKCQNDLAGYICELDAEHSKRLKELAKEGLE